MKVLLAHGLNNNQACLADIKKKLHEFNIDYTCLFLHGHPGHNIPEQGHTTWLDWKNDFKCSFHELISKNPEHQNIILIGFSLGALIYCASLLEEEKNYKYIKKMILLSPAIIPRQYVNVLSALYNVFPDGFVPSSNISKWHEHDQVHLSTFNALIEGVTEINLHPKIDILNKIPTTIILDNRDLCISSQKIVRFVHKKLPKWHVHKVKLLHSAFPSYHITFDASCYKRGEWDSFWHHELAAFLN